MSNLTAISDSTFERETLHSDLPVLVDFWAKWCGPCRMIAPVLEEIASEYEGRIKVTKLDVDSSPRTASQFGVQSIPTLIIFKDGVPVERIIGFMQKDRLIEKLSPHLAPVDLDRIA